MTLTRRESNLFILAVASVCAVAGTLRADVSQCGCDVKSAETMARRECSLCGEAEKHPAETGVFLLKDNNPRKPNRWLALPRKHGAGAHSLQEMSREEQVAVLKTAIGKGRELFGDEWGIAYNGWRVRTQCHGHVHIGKLLKGLAPGKYVDVARVEEIPLPKDDGGFWVHAVGAKLRVHIDEDITETTLLR